MFDKGKKGYVFVEIIGFPVAPLLPLHSLRSLGPVAWL